MDTNYFDVIIIKENIFLKHENIWNMNLSVEVSCNRSEHATK